MAQRLSHRRRHHSAHVAHNRLVLHFLRHVHAARYNPACHASSVVSVPELGVEYLLRVAVGRGVSDGRVE